MRYYSVTFTPTDGRKLSIPVRFSSHDENGLFNPGCLEVEFEIINAWGHVFASQTHLRIHNPTLDMIRYARQYNGCACEIRGGFKRGLPLANPDQAGLIGYGQVQNCFANWLGTDMVLDFLLLPSIEFGSPDLNYSANTGPGSPFPYQFKWGGEGNAKTLLEAIQNTFKPQGITVTGSISPKTEIAPQTPIIDVRYSFQGFSELINQLSLSVVDPANYRRNGQGGNFQGYLGVSLTYLPGSKTVLAWDGATPQGAINLQPQDFIGQPTWLNAQGFLQSVHPMRADINLGFSVQYPKNLPTIASPAYISAGRFLLVSPSGGSLAVQQVRHVGRFRDQSPTGWATYVDASSAYRVNPEPEKLPDGDVSIGEPEEIQQ